MTQKLKKLTFLLVSVSFLHIESSVIHDLKALTKGVVSSSYTDELWAIYENIMTGSRFVLKFSFLHNFVNFVCTDMYDTSKYSRVQGLSFAYYT